MITTEEVNSLKFYQGDINGYLINSSEDKSKYESNFYKTRSAYHILNMLMYPGIDNEITRICNENKKLPIHLIESIDELLFIYKNIFSAMCKYKNHHKKNGTIYAFRKDRIQSKNALSQNYLPSITSCSLENNIDNYFLKKDGILLLEYEIPNYVPHIILNDVISDSVFQYQNEILLPPFLRFEKVALEFTEEEYSYRDINDEPPKEKYLIKIKDIHFNKEAANFISNGNASINTSIEKIVTDKASYAVKILKKITDHIPIDEDEIMWYSEWKKDVKKIIFKTFYEIYKNLY